MKRTIFLLAAMAGVSMLGVACERPGPHAAGSGYGVGIPRQALILRGEPRWNAGSKLGFRDSAHPPEANPLTWNPAVAVGADETCGHLAMGKRLSAKTP